MLPGPGSDSGSDISSSAGQAGEGPALLTLGTGRVRRVQRALRSVGTEAGPASEAGLVRDRHAPTMYGDGPRLGAAGLERGLFFYSLCLPVLAMAGTGTETERKAHGKQAPGLQGVARAR